ncbi:hypothetical protein HQ590_07475 [bacterium]|nr:hypothetical protein [bacterium]
MGFKQRAVVRRERIVGHVARTHEEAERWDLEFWQRLGPEARLSALVAIHADVRAVKAGRRRSQR